MSEIPIDPILKVLGPLVKKIVENADFGHFWQGYPLQQMAKIVNLKKPKKP